MSNSIIEGLVDYFLGCPILEDGMFRVDSLGDEAIEYSIETGVTTQPILEEYVDGSSVRQYLFVFASRNAYSLDRVENIGNSGFYERLASWIEEQGKEGNLPDMPEGCRAEKIQINAPGYLLDAGEATAKYQIQLNLVYFKEA